MSAEADSLSSRLLKVEGVAGVGHDREVVTVYLQEDSDPVRHLVREVVRELRPRFDVRFVVAGRFQAQFGT